MKKYRGEPTPLYLAAYVGGSNLESGHGQGPSEHTALPKEPSVTQMSVPPHQDCQGQLCSI